MKICPKCKIRFPDDLYFCLEDGSTLKDYDAFDSAATLAVTEMATFELKNSPTGKQNGQTDQPAFINSPRNSKKSVLIGGFLAVAVLSSAATFGAVHYFRARQTTQDLSPPTIPNYSPVSPNNTDAAENLKVEILGEVINNSGDSFYKCRMTNVGETVIRPFVVTLIFYKDDVAVKESYGDVELEYLQPQQSVPVWVSADDAEKYTSVKIKQPVTTFPIGDPAKQLFLELTVKDAEMERASSDGYEVRGILENTNYESVSTEAFVIFYDRKSEIIGIESKSFFGLQKDDKVKFEVGIGKDKLFGEPKTFEIVFVAQ